jgi:hypothetical protein
MGFGQFIEFLLKSQTAVVDIPAAADELLQQLALARLCIEGKSIGLEAKHAVLHFASSSPPDQSE